MTNFPTGLDDFPNPTADTAMDIGGELSHHAQHTNVNDAIAAIEAKIGINNSSDPDSLDYRIRELEEATGPAVGGANPITFNDGIGVKWGSGSTQIIGHHSSRYIRFQVFNGTSGVIAATIDYGATTGNFFVIGPSSSVDPFNQYIRASDGNGTNVRGSDLWLGGGRATGDVYGGDVVLATSLKSSFTGAALRALQERFRVSTTYVHSHQPLHLGALGTSLDANPVPFYVYGKATSSLESPSGYNRLAIYPSSGGVQGYYNIAVQNNDGQYRELRILSGLGDYGIDFGGVPGYYYSGVFLRAGGGTEPDRGLARTPKGLALSSKSGNTAYSLRGHSFFVMGDSNPGEGYTPQGLNDSAYP